MNLFLPGFNSERQHKQNLKSGLQGWGYVAFHFAAMESGLVKNGNQFENPYFVSDDLFSVSLETELAARAAGIMFSFLFKLWSIKEKVRF